MLPPGTPLFRVNRPTFQPDNCCLHQEPQLQKCLTNNSDTLINNNDDDKWHFPCAQGCMGFLGLSHSILITTSQILQTRKLRDQRTLKPRL